MKIKQKHICQKLRVSDTVVSLILSGKRPVSWPLAAKLASIFKEKTTEEWKQATPEDLRRVFHSMQKEG